MEGSKKIQSCKVQNLILLKSEMSLHQCQAPPRSLSCQLARLVNSCPLWLTCWMWRFWVLRMAGIASVLVTSSVSSPFIDYFVGLIMGRLGQLKLGMQTLIFPRWGWLLSPCLTSPSPPFWTLHNTELEPGWRIGTGWAVAASCW